jgi:hypothetical protein
MLSLYLIAGIVGVMLFFSVVVAPSVFKVLPQEWASVYVRSFFPKYYLVLGTACLLAGIFSHEIKIQIIALTSAILFAISLWVLTPKVNAAKDENNTKIFNILHGVSIAINMIVMVILTYCFWI